MSVGDFSLVLGYGYSNVQAIDDTGLVVAIAGSRVIYVSKDGGLTWDGSTPIPDGDLLNIAFGGGVFVLFVYERDTYRYLSYTTSDFKTWSTAGDGVGVVSDRSVAVQYYQGLFYAIDALKAKGSASAVYGSPDGKTWSLVASAPTSSPVQHPSSRYNFRGLFQFKGALHAFVHADRFVDSTYIDTDLIYRLDQGGISLVTYLDNVFTNNAGVNGATSQTKVDFSTYNCYAFTGSSYELMGTSGINPNSVGTGVYTGDDFMLVSLIPNLYRRSSSGSWSVVQRGRYSNQIQWPVHRFGEDGPLFSVFNDYESYNSQPVLSLDNGVTWANATPSRTPDADLYITATGVLFTSSEGLYMLQLADPVKPETPAFWTNTLLSYETP